jgi:hypothetical protein
VHFATLDGDAVAGADYTARTGKVTIDAGKVSASIKPSALGDTLDEHHEAFTIRLSRVTGATLGDCTGAVTIGDDDPLPSVELLNCGTIEDPSGLTDEGDAGTHTVPFVVRLSVVSGRDVSVHLVTTDFTATSPGDYLAVSATLTIPAGAASAAGDVTINGDTATENDELFFATIDTPVNATISNDNSYCDIVNDD